MREMANSLCKSSVQKTYQDVINDVISNIRDHFLEDGVDEQVLQELRQLWENKLTATKAVEDTKEMEKLMQTQNKIKQDQLDYQKTQQQLRQVVGQVPPNNHVTMMPPEYRRVPIQLTIPQLPGSNEGQKTLAIEVPDLFLQGNHLKNILTPSVVSTAMGLPIFTACAFLQDLVNRAFIKHQQMSMTVPLAPTHLINPSVIQPESLVDNLKSINQCDGAEDSTDDDDLSGNDDDGNPEDMEEDEGGTELEEEPLNSEDDVSDADEGQSSFDTDNVIVCQYDKITRSRNKWKFHFKDGIMNLDGTDYVFQKANGDAEW